MIDKQVAWANQQAALESELSAAREEAATAAALRDELASLRGLSVAHLCLLFVLCACVCLLKVDQLSIVVSLCHQCAHTRTGFFF